MAITLKDRASLIQFYGKAVKLLKDNPHTPEYRQWLINEYFTADKISFKPLRPFFNLLSQIDSKYKPYIKTDFTLENIDQFTKLLDEFRSSYQFRPFLEEYNRAIQYFDVPHPLNSLREEEIKALAEAENTPEEQERAQKFEDFIDRQQPASSGSISFPHPAGGGGGSSSFADSSSTTPATPPPSTGYGTTATNKSFGTKTPAFEPKSYTILSRRPQVPGVVKDIGSKANIGLIKLKGRAPGFIGGFLSNIGKTGMGVLGGGGQMFSRIGGGSGIGGRFSSFSSGLASNPKRKAALLLILGLFFFLALFMSFFQTGEGGATPVTSTSRPNNQAQIAKIGPKVVDNPEASNPEKGIIRYELTVSYNGTGTADIQVIDSIDQTKVEFVSATEGGVNPEDSGNITWNVTGIGPGQPKKLELVVKAKKSDVWVINQAGAKVLTTHGTATFAGGEGCPTKEQLQGNGRNPNNPDKCQYLNPALPLFYRDLIPEDLQNYKQNFISTYKDDFIGKPLVGGGVGTLPEFERRVNLIFDKSREAGLNPVLFLGYWSSESKFSTYTTATADLGCDPYTNAFPGFENQVICATGLAPNGSRPSRCAREALTDAPNLQAACNELKSIREQGIDAKFTPLTNKQIYDAANHPISYPIHTWDDYAEAYGSRSPLLVTNAEKAAGVTNNNCTHSYNDLLFVATSINACKVTPAPASAGGIAACKFTKRDQDPAAVPYQSSTLLNYFEEVGQKTGVPAQILAGIVRVESTTGKYTISNYTNSDLTLMENTSSIVNNIDATVPNTDKALCPRSPTGALGITQIQPPKQIHDLVQQQTGIPPFSQVGAYDKDAVSNGIKLATQSGVLATSKNVNNITIQDFCNPKVNLYLGAGFILSKLANRGYGTTYGDGSRWDPSWTTNKTVIDAVARRYYGSLVYGPNDEFSYGDDLFTSINECKLERPDSP